MNPYIRTLVEGMSRHPVMIRPQFFTEGIVIRGKEVTSWGNFAADVKALASVDVVDMEEQALRRRNELCKAYGFAGSDATKPFAFAGGNAIIPIHGTLMNRLPYSFGFATGYNFITGQLAQAMADPDVTRIVYDVNSNGGTVAGCPECAAAMFAASAAQGGKPSIALVDTNCYSAAYYLASAADRIAVTPSGGAGSIGVVMMHVDLSKALEEFGINISFIHAGDHKVDGNPFQPLSEEVTSDFQASVDKIYGKFVADVAKQRPNLSEQAVRDTQARVYQADDALALGLVDSVQTPSDALQSLDAESEVGGPFMATENNKPTDVAATQQAERARISGIVNHPEAAGRADLAHHLAFDTDMSVEAAAGILAKAPKPAAAAPTPPATTEQAKPAAEVNHFKNAMDNSKHPNAGAEGGGDGGEAPSPAKRILSAQAKATGFREQPAQK